MTYFFELIAKKVGFSRIGRIVIFKEGKKYLATPNIIIPMNSILKQNSSFVREFENHDLFQISNEKYLKDVIQQGKYDNTGFIYSHTGTLVKFKEILEKNFDIFSKHTNIIVNIPFNIPTTALTKIFAINEIKNYLKNINKILKKYPNLNFGISIRIFDFPELISLYKSTIYDNNNIKLLNLTDLFDNFSKYRKILNLIIQIKQEFDNNIVLMSSGKITPKFYPILTYLGIDLIDSSYLLYLSSENFYNTIEYLLPIYKLKFFPCSCIACRGRLKDLLEEKHSSEKINLLCLHNLITAKNYMNKIKQYLNYEDFRAFLEKSSLDDINIISMLKILDKQHFELLRYETPIIQKNKTINCLGPSSYYRPDFQIFRERVIKNFTPEPSTRLILLLPCSARKPYSESKSHRKFHSIIRKFPEFPDFQEIILTSPLGAIPRQLENIYPVNSYDISVTGDWDNEEINITADMLIKLLKKFDKNIPIICHLEEGGYLEIVKRVSSKVQNLFYYSEIQERITSAESLQSLENLINENKDKFSFYEDVSKINYLTKTRIRKFIKILDYQFGPGSGSKIISNELKLRKNRNITRIELIDVKTQDLLGVYMYSSGFIELTLKGAKKMGPFSKNSKIIIFDGNKLIGNTLFRPGVLDFNSELIPNENVILLDREKKEIIGVGNMIVGSNFIKNSKTGRIAKIYERAN